MCGIAGILSKNRSGEPDLRVVDRMTAQLDHRGPDGAGSWRDHEARVGLGHRRLSIVDLSDAGRQPMVSPTGRYVISYNGEVYNFRGLRRELADVFPFQGSSDTEVVLAAIEHWGLVEAVRRFVGMFAFAIWDRRDRVLHLVRDRLGEKPLYYGWIGGDFVFASELKALRVHPAWTGDIDRRALSLMMRYAYVPSPLAIYRDIYKLPAGNVLTLKSTHGLRRPSIEPYWSPRTFFEAGRRDPITGDETGVLAQFEVLLRDAIRDQMVADVPLGAFLSGGLDSTLLVALMQKQSSRPVRTFTIGFPEGDFNEARHAKDVAAFLGTRHTELYVSQDDLLDAVAQMPIVYDEPFADPSQVPTHLLAKLTREHVTVSLSGDGADELFGGYQRYQDTLMGWRRMQRMGPLARTTLARLLVCAEPAAAPLRHQFNRFLPKRFRDGDLDRKVFRWSRLLPVRQPDDYYRWTMSRWTHPRTPVRDCQLRDVDFEGPVWPSRDDFSPHMMYYDLVTYLPDNILVKVDRAAMAAGLETRAPYLDHRLVEFALQLHTTLKVRGGTGKWLLRRLLDQHIPRELVDRPKQGFAAPIAKWLRGPLRDWAEALLDPCRLQQTGFFDRELVRRKWDEHVSGKTDYWNNDLWSVLMFQAWLEQSTAAADLNVTATAC